MKKALCVAACSIVFGISGNASALQLIENGDFETGDFTGWDLSIIPGGNSVEYVGGAYGYAAKLNDPTSFGWEALFQDFFIPTGTIQLSISFDYLFEGIDSNSRKDDWFKAELSYWDGSYGSFFGLPYEDWTEEIIVEDYSSGSSFNMIAHYTGLIDLTSLADRDPNGKIRFTLRERSYRDNLDTHVYIDNVSVTTAPVPEPSTMLIFGTGIAGLAAVRRKRK